MNIWLVENDDDIRNDLRAALERARGADSVRPMSTEYEFYAALEEIDASPPDLVVLDVFLPWTLPGPVMPAPPIEVQEGKQYGAGVRCKNLLRKICQAPVIFYTGLAKRDLARELSNTVLYVAKDITDIRPLTALVEQLRHGGDPR
jgi:CheY-like chemotaxis protein